MEGTHQEETSKSANAATGGTPTPEELGAGEVTQCGASASPGERLRLIEEAEKKQLGYLKKIMKGMEESFKKQKNIAKGVKDGFEEIREIADRIRTFSDARVQAYGSLGDSGGMTIGTPARSAGASTRADSNKRPRDSPSSPSDDPETSRGKGGGWQVAKRTRKRPKKEIAPGGATEASQAQQGVANREKSDRKGRDGGRARLPKPRLDAIVVRLGDGKSYADVLGKIKGSVKLEESGTEVRRIRKTRAGGVLLELEGCGDKVALEEAIARAISGDGTVKGLKPRLRLEVLDLDSCVSQAEVEEAVRRELPDLTGDLSVVVFPPNKREERMAVVEMDEGPARQILSKGRVRVGWVVARIRMRIDADRCFRCHGFGHTRQDCKGPDRSLLCRKCGKAEHKAAACTEISPRCYLCPPKPDGEMEEHTAGSGACKAFREALAARKKKAGR